MKAHTGDKRFQCTQNDCHASFVTCYHLRKHIENIHSSPKFKHICDKCDMKFATLQELNQHSLQSHKQSAFMCREGIIHHLLHTTYY